MKRLLAILVLAITLPALFGCGGGGGGAPPATVRGRIIFIGTGQPLSGAAVDIGGSKITTDATGVFSFQSVSSASTTLAVTATGVKDLLQPLPPLAPQHAINDLGDVFVVDSNSLYEATASGTVVRGDNLKPIPGARVLLSGRQAITGANGQFSFTGLPVGLGGAAQVGLITATGLEDKPFFIDPALGKSPPDNALGNIPMSPPVGTIPGGPTNIGGKVALQGAADLSGTLVELVRKSDNAVVASLTTLADGRFGFWVVTGQYAVRASHAGFTTQSLNVTLASTAVPQTVDITLVP